MAQVNRPVRRAARPVLPGTGRVRPSVVRPAAVERPGVQPGDLSHATRDPGPHS